MIPYFHHTHVFHIVSPYFNQSEIPLIVKSPAWDLCLFGSWKLFGQFAKLLPRHDGLIPSSRIGTAAQVVTRYHWIMPTTWKF